MLQEGEVGGGLKIVQDQNKFKTKLKTNMKAQSTSYASAILLLRARLRVLGVVGFSDVGP